MREWERGRRERKLSERLARQIVSDLVDQGTEVGERLMPEHEMCQLYGVGRSTLREAIRLLESDGLLSVRPGPRGGPVVRDLAPSDFADTAKLHFRMRGVTYQEVFDARLAIEPLLARLAAESGDDDALHRLQEVLAEGRLIDISDQRAWSSNSAAFHSTVASMSGNRVLDLIASSLPHIYLERIHQREVPMSIRESTKAMHEEIGLAICERRGADAEEAMARHLRGHTPSFDGLFGVDLGQRVVW